MDTLIYQTGMMEYIEKYPNLGVMIPVYGHTGAFGTDAYFQCRLCSYETAAEEMTTDNTNRWDSVTPGFTQYGCGENAEIIYSRFNNDRNMEPFVIERDFNGLGVENEIEIVEEFRLLNNLYFERSRNEYRDLEADTVVIRIEGDFVCVNRKYLKRYLAVKNMVMLVHIDSRYITDRFDPEIKPQYEEHTESDDKIYTFNFGVLKDFPPKRNFSLFYVKALIRGCKLEECGYWPYDEVDRKYEDYIIGVNSDGQDILFSSDPDKLSNYFGKNPEAPHYLTPVFFKREVLQKYYGNPKRFSVEDGIIRCGVLWALYVDNQHDDYISAYLGDLGRDLPNQQEQQHWKSFNIAIDGKLSKSKFKRDFGAQFADPDSPVFIFQNKYKSLNLLSEKKLGWPIFLPLHDDDQYNLESLRIPLSNAQPEFDMLILSLVKVLLDSLNEKQIVSRLAVKPDELKGSISKLERWFDTCGIVDYAGHVKFLRNLQELRSCGTGHRKGKGYDKIVKELNVTDGDFRRSFKDILIQAIAFLDFVACNADALSGLSS